MKDEQMKNIHYTRIRLFIGLSFIVSSFINSSLYAATPATVYMEDLTWMEIRERIKDGATIAIIPTGGTEQNGPHMITGKHNYIVRYTAGEIAKKLGNALVAPVMAYVPEGRINPPEGHMNFPGTLSLSNETFSLVLQDAAESLKQNGFTLICFVGDSGGNQQAQKEVAKRLSEMWAGSDARVLNVSDYYDNNGQDKWIQSIGLNVQTPGAHAGLEDTSELMKIKSIGVRANMRGTYTERDYRTTGAMGDATKASAEYGQQLLDQKINAAVNQISKSSRAK
jgi:creatinine amidohydrolase/Fe(II)-dependent formamide hydrolase-like protein